MNWAEFKKPWGEWVKAPQFGRGHLGYSPGGAMDVLSWLRNKTSDTSLEVGPFSLKVKIKKDGFFSWVGAKRDVYLRGQKCCEACFIKVFSGDEISIERARLGNYSYFAFSAKPQMIFHYPKDLKPKKGEIRVVVGPEWDKRYSFLKEIKSMVSLDSNKMGIRLNILGKYFSHLSDLKMHSVPVWDGVVQWTGTEMIVLGRQRQTIGGYPRVLQVLPLDLNVLCQVQVRQVTTLKVVSSEEASILFKRYLEWKSYAMEASVHW